METRHGLFDPGDYIRKKGLTRTSKVCCPVCRKPFLAKDGHVFKWKFLHAEDEVREEEYIFCSLGCILVPIPPFDAYGNGAQ